MSGERLPLCTTRGYLHQIVPIHCLSHGNLLPLCRVLSPCVTGTTVYCRERCEYAGGAVDDFFAPRESRDHIVIKSPGVSKPFYCDGAKPCASYENTSNGIRKRFPEWLFKTIDWASCVIVGDAVLDTVLQPNERRWGRPMVNDRRWQFCRNILAKKTNFDVSKIIMEYAEEVPNESFAVYNRSRMMLYTYASSYQKTVEQVWSNCRAKGQNCETGDSDVEMSIVAQDEVTEIKFRMDAAWTEAALEDNGETIHIQIIRDARFDMALLTCRCETYKRDKGTADRLFIPHEAYMMMFILSASILDVDYNCLFYNGGDRVFGSVRGLRALNTMKCGMQRSDKPYTVSSVFGCVARGFSVYLTRAQYKVLCSEPLVGGAFSFNFNFDPPSDNELETLIFDRFVSEQQRRNPKKTSSHYTDAAEAFSKAFPEHHLGAWNGLPENAVSGFELVKSAMKWN